MARFGASVDHIYKAAKAVVETVKVATTVVEKVEDVVGAVEPKKEVKKNELKKS